MTKTFSATRSVTRINGEALAVERIDRLIRRCEARYSRAEILKVKADEIDASCNSLDDVLARQANMRSIFDEVRALRLLQVNLGLFPDDFVDWPLLTRVCRERVKLYQEQNA